MHKFKIILRDCYRFYFRKIKKKSIRDISIWKTPSFSIEEREMKLKKINEWLDCNEKNNMALKIPCIQNNFINTVALTNDILAEKRNKEIVPVLFELFNKKKYVSGILTSNFKNQSKAISLEAYCNLSLIFIKEYKSTKNIQFLNSSLKISDFLLFSQINSGNKRFNGSIANYFPSCKKGFIIDNSTNRLFASVIKEELEILKKL